MRHVLWLIVLCPSCTDKHTGKHVGEYSEEAVADPAYAMHPHLQPQNRERFIFFDAHGTMVAPRKAKIGDIVMELDGQGRMIRAMYLTKETQRVMLAHEKH